MKSGTMVEDAIEAVKSSSERELLEIYSVPARAIRAEIGRAMRDWVWAQTSPTAVAGFGLYDPLATCVHEGQI